MIRNSDSESISYWTYEKFSLCHPQTLRLVSSDRKIFQVPQVLFSFLSRYCEKDHDVMLAPIHSDQLAALVNIIDPRDVSGEREEVSQDVLTGAELVGIERSTLESVLTARRTVKVSREQVREMKEETEIIEGNLLYSLALGEQTYKINTDDENLEEGEAKPEDVNDSDKGPFEDKKQIRMLDVIGEDPDDDEKGEKDEKTNGDFDKKGNRILRWKHYQNQTYRSRRVVSKVCKYCGKVFTGEIQLRLFRTHFYRHQIRENICDCDVEFKSYIEKERHVRTVHRGHVACTQCSVTCRSAQSLQHHLDTAHGKTLACTVCNYITDQAHKLKEHMSRKHVPSVIKSPSEYSCTSCDKAFNSLKKKSDHNYRSHNPQTCNICGKSFKQLKRHMEVVHSDDSQKRFLCPDCGKGFVDISALSNHQMNVHIKTRPYKCRYPECTRREPGYNDQGNRNSHEKRVHGGLYTKRSNVPQ